MEIEVTGIDHLYLAVRDLERSQRFYDPVMHVLGFRKRSGPLPGSGELHVHYYNRAIQLTLRPAAAGSRDHDPYSPGLHHLCLRVADRAAVDAVARGLREHGVEATPPRAHPEYHADYYATFFDDPDGLRLEVVNHMDARRAVASEWERIPPILA
jgi:glyoxylase I family protein